MNYVLPLFTLQNMLHIYDNSFGLLSHKLMWQEYKGDQCGTKNEEIERRNMKEECKGSSDFESHSH